MSDESHAAPAAAASPLLPPPAPPPPPLSNPSLDVSGRIFLVTGGTQGLGLEIACQLKRNGAAAIVLVSRSPDRFRTALDRLYGDDDGGDDGHDGGDDGEEDTTTPTSSSSPTSRSHGCIVRFVRADLSDADDASSAMPRAVELLSRETSLPKPVAITGVVNAAATTSRGNLATTTAIAFDEQFATNVRGPFLITQAAAEHMADARVPRGTCSIVNVCSVASKGGAPFIMGYSCAKSALVTLTRNNAAELAPRGIRVNGIDMGWCLTENEHALQSRARRNPEWWREADGGVPLGRILRPADVAATAVFLLSGASVMMTGSILDLHPEYPFGMLSTNTEDDPDR